MGELHAGRYELVDHLGEGGGGSVWRAWDHRRGRYVAAKLLRHRDGGMLLRFVQEQSVRVEHPHVAPPTGWAAEDDDVLLTMDLVDGGSVADLLDEGGALPVPFAVVLVDQLLDALAGVHAAGVVHRDVKPSNLLLEATGTGPPVLRLANFGIAVLTDRPRLTSTGIVLGTPGYVPPEVMRGAGSHPGQDLWSTGTLLRHLLTGVRPEQDVMVDPAGDPVPGGIPPAIWEFGARLAATDPARRPPDAPAARALLAEAVASAGLGDAVAAVGTPAAAGRRVDVRRRLPALPRGWDTDGPVSGVEPEPAGQAATSALPPLTATAPAPPAPSLPPPVQRGDGTPGGRRLALAVGGTGLVLSGAIVALAISIAQLTDDDPADPAGERAGRPCDVSQAGQTRTTPEEIVCDRSPDGSHRWRLLRP